MIDLDNTQKEKNSPRKSYSNSFLPPLREETIDRNLDKNVPSHM